MNKKKILIIILIVITAFVIIFAINRKNNKERIANINQTEQILVEQLEDGTKLNTSSKLSETKKVGNLEISNSQLTNKNGKTTLLADVKNVGNETIQMLELQIILLDQNGKEVKTLSGLLGTIKPGGMAQLNVSAQNDYSNIYDYIVKIKQ